jgi:hypothetical protein
MKHTVAMLKVKSLKLTRMNPLYELAVNFSCEQCIIRVIVNPSIPFTDLSII